MKMFRQAQSLGGLLTVLFAWGVLAASCVVPLDPADSGEALVRIGLPDAGSGRLLVADATRYRLTVKPAKGETKVATFAAGDAVVLRTLPGSTTLLLDAYDSANHLLTHGETTLLLAAGVNDVAITLEPTVTLEAGRALYLQARQVGYFFVSPPGAFDPLVSVGSQDQRIWLCDADGSYSGDGLVGPVPVPSVVGGKQVLRVKQGSTSGYLTLNTGNTGLVVSTEIASEWQPNTTVNRLDNEQLNLRFRLAATITLSAVYVDGSVVTNGTGAYWNSDANGVSISVSSWGPTMGPGRHSTMLVFADAEGHYWSFAWNYHLIEKQALVVAASGNLNAVIKTDGSLWTWNQTAGATAYAADVPTRVGTEFTWKTVSVSNSHFVAVKNDGSLWTWGANAVGQLGLGDTLAHPTPTQAAASNIGDVAAGPLNSYTVLTGDNFVWGAGANDSSQLNSAPYAFNTNPASVFETQTWKVLAGSGYALALGKDQRLYGWGKDDRGQLGDAGAAGAASLVRTIDPAYTWFQVATGWDHVLAVRNDNTLWTWGDNNKGQLGTRAADNQVLAPSQVHLPADPNRPWLNDNSWSTLAAGDGLSYATNYSGMLWVWGNGVSDVPQQWGTDQDWKRVVAGGNHVLAVKFDNSVWTWTVGDTAPTKVFP